MKRLIRLTALLGFISTCFLHAVAPAQTIVQLTNSVPPVAHRDPTITADGSKVAFLSTLSGDWHIFTINSDGTGLTAIVNFPVFPPVFFAPDRLAVISPDGSNIAFASQGNPLGTNPDLNPDLFIMNSDGTSLVQLTNSPGVPPPPFTTALSPIGHLSVSADGSKVVFVSDRDLVGTNGDGKEEIYIINSDGTGLIQLTNSPQFAFGPSISANGAKIVFSSGADPFGTNPLHKLALFVVNSDGTGLTQITPPAEGCNGGLGCSPEASISSDGSKIAFLSPGDPLGTNPEGDQQIFVINSDGTGLAQLTFGPGDVEPASISADGSKIAFGWNGDPLGANPVDSSLDPSQRHRQVFVINSDGTGLLQLTNTRGLFNNSPANSFPTRTSNDGSKIVFQANANFPGTNSSNPEIYLVTLVTNTPVGASVVVQPADITNGTTPATLTFSTVNQAGTTTLITNNSGPEPPVGFKLGDPATYFGLATNALFSDAITVCIDYSGIDVGAESQLNLFHFEGGVWVDHTLSLDTINNIICASVTSFSLFSIFEAANQPPVANAGVDQVVECGSHTGTTVVLDGSGSSDPDGDPLTFTWTGPFGTLNGQTISATLPLGTHIISLAVEDGKGGSASDTVLVTVQDTTPPTLSVSLSPGVLWPPNHKLVQITASTQVSDGCDANPSVVLLSIISSEPDNGLGQGDTPNDIQGADFGTDDRSFFLRAERSGKGAGRIYTATYRAMDASGNTSLATSQVTIPHDQRKP